MTHTPVLHESLPVYSEGLKPSVSLKRINPATGVPFKRGDTRADGRKFQGYGAAISKKTGLLYEWWLTPERFKQENDYQTKYQVEYRKANPNYQTKYQVEYRKANPDYSVSDYRANLEKIKSRITTYQKANRGKVNAWAMRRHAAKMQRTPPWLTKKDFADIAKIYELCAERTRVTGIPHAVDHVIPLQGRTVSGLHIASNLQIITAAENCSKNNKYVQE